MQTVYIILSVLYFVERIYQPYVLIWVVCFNGVMCVYH